MGSQLNDRVGRWVASIGIDPRLAPTPATLAANFGHGPDPCRRGAAPDAIDAWERRHGFPLPGGLRAWLRLSDGFYLGGPLIHPLSAIGPMVPFARVPDLVVQPESWFELGNPNVETVCIDLAYRWPGGDSPIFTSGDDQSQSHPRVIATSFEGWFLTLLHRGGREFWFEPGFAGLGDPWGAHRRYAPAPPLPDRLRSLAPHVLPYLRPGADDRAIATTLGISRGDVETIFRHLQHGAPGFAGS
ncbi:MAG: hypothetical protein QOE66_2838 [Chloroflexota bacterium]|jgi:hypothetical protein|nr:hypothetical protein [Chloroflexota bacterium]